MPEIVFTTVVERVRAKAVGRPPAPIPAPGTPPAPPVPNVVAVVGIPGRDGGDGPPGPPGQAVVDDPGDLTLIFDNKLF